MHNLLKSSLALLSLSAAQTAKASLCHICNILKFSPPRQHLQVNKSSGTSLSYRHQLEPRSLLRSMGEANERSKQLYPSHDSCALSP